MKSSYYITDMTGKAKSVFEKLFCFYQKIILAPSKSHLNLLSGRTDQFMLKTVHGASYL